MKFCFLLLLATTLFSCQSKKAKEYITLLDSTERKVFHILIDKNTEDKRLEALIAEKPDSAIFYGNKQANELNKVLRDMEKAQLNNLPDGEALKKSTVAYYKVVAQMKDLDLQEARLMVVQSNGDKTKSKEAQNAIFNMARKRVEIHKVLGQLDQERYRAKSKFEETNHLK
ncbi:hypothetical protein [Pedobacter aquatilis]|uniref:hypothetical protein n=1 Tax=Pedobacter aquatilis TaxID=351343 RepID=UPI00292D3BF0|nr:hypothetical protein [Pedobacter aquatilis]